HLTAGVGQPAQAAGVENELLLLELEHEQLEQVPFPPQNVGHLAQAHLLLFPGTLLIGGGPGEVSTQSADWAGWISPEGPGRWPGPWPRGGRSRPAWRRCGPGGS